MNALDRALTIQRDAAGVGFDWPDIQGVLDKVLEEVQEIRDALEQGDRTQAQSELGDLFFSAVNLARFLDKDPGEALDETSDRFEKRFDRVKQEVRQRGLEIQSCALRDLDALWDEVKSQERQALEKGG